MWELKLGVSPLSTMAQVKGQSAGKATLDFNTSFPGCAQEGARLLYLPKLGLGTEQADPVGCSIHRQVPGLCVSHVRLEHSTPWQVEDLGLEACLVGEPNAK